MAQFAAQAPLRRGAMVLMLATAALSAQSALAAMTVRFADSYGTTNGGEFRATVTGTFGGFAVPSQFQTFCMERNEHIMFGQVNGVDPFVVESIAEYANGGGVSGGPTDMLSGQTKWLYERFATGTLAGYDYGATRPASADALQNVLWYLEGEFGAPGSGSALTALASFNPLSNAFLALANQAIAGGWVDPGVVRVMNIRWAVDYGGNDVGDRAQSQLVLIPAPGAVLLGIVGCIGLAAFRRRATVMN